MRLEEIFKLPFIKSKPAQTNTEYDDSTVKHKAGLLPYFINEDHTIEFLLMVSSDAKFGGPDPMISKGGVDYGENIQQAAVREAEEELGLKKSNIVSKLQIIYDEQITGLDNKYHMTFFTCQVKNKHDFKTYHYETAHTKWMTNEQFQQHGRKAHRIVVQRAYNIVTKGG